MPTFNDPKADAAEASEALRGLAHASRVFPDPANTYPVLGDLIAGVRSLRQILDQVAAAHTSQRVRAHDDAGSQLAGASAALAAAGELHQAGAVLDRVQEHLDAAMTESGRIAWHAISGDSEKLAEARAERTVAHAGALTLRVWPVEPLGDHHRYGYLIEDADTGTVSAGRDLFTGTTRVEPAQAIRELAGYLRAAGDARKATLENPDAPTMHTGMFPEPIAEAARRNADALAALVEHPTAPLPAETPPRWISVVFLQGEDADAVLDVIEKDGTDAAIGQLSGYDYGEETMQAALTHGYVYDQPPAGTLDRTASNGVYTLTYNPFLGHVSLLREYDVAPDPALRDNPVTASMRRDPDPAPSRTRGTDWFAYRSRTHASSRELSL